MLFAVGRRNQLWVSLIEKALAKVYGNYAALRLGTIQEGLSILTGSHSEYISIQKEIVTGLDILWAKLLSAKEAGFFMGCEIENSIRFHQKYINLGLQKGHAYSILDVRKYGVHKLLKVRNPWGNFIWRGEWSPYWDGWNNQEKWKTDLNYNNTGEENGTFWISFDDFVKYFDFITISYITGNLGYNSHKYHLNSFWERPTALMVTVNEYTKVSFSLFQKNARTTESLADLRILVHKEGSKEEEPGELVIQSGCECISYVRTKETFLEPGNYIVYALNFDDFFGVKRIETILVLHSDKDVETKLVNSAPKFLRKSLIEMVVKGKNVDTKKIECLIYEAHGDFDKCLLVAENRNKRDYIRVSFVLQRC